MSRLRFLPDRHRVAAATLALALVGLSCVKQEQAGVKVQPLKADIDFGVKLPEPTGTLTPPVPVSAKDQPNELALLPIGNGFKPIALRAKPICPPAAANAFPDKTAELDVEGMPVEGQYRWKRSGSFTTSGVTIPITGLEQRFVRRVKQVSETTNTDGRPNRTYTFQTVQPIAADTVVVTSYQVITNAPGQTEVNVLTGQRVRTGDPERGLVVKKYEIIDTKTGNASYTFDVSTTPGVLLFPFPVAPGTTEAKIPDPDQQLGTTTSTVPTPKLPDTPESVSAPGFTSTATDPKTGDSVTVQGSVKNRVQLDACGEVIEGWLMEGTRTTTITDKETNQRKQETVAYSLVVAPQYGGMPIYEKIVPQGATDPATFEYTIGQITPKPLPDEAK